MKKTKLLKRTAALLLSSTMLVSLPVTVNAATVTDNGEYEILFHNTYYGGTIDGIHDSKHVSFNFDSNDEVVNLSDLVGNDVKYKFYALEGWMLDINWSMDDDSVTTITKDDFGEDHYLDVYAKFDYNYPKNTDTYYIEMNFGSGTSNDYGLEYGSEVVLDFPKSQFGGFTLPDAVPPADAEFLGWVESGVYYQGNGSASEHYTTITASDFSSYSDVIDVKAVYKKKAGPNDTTRVLTLDANGGTIDGKASERYVSTSESSVQDISLFIPQNTDPDLRFAGWNTEPDGSGVILTHTGFPDEDPVSEEELGTCDIFKYFGDANQNLTLYAKWVKDPVRPETNSAIDQKIAAKAVKELEHYRDGQYNTFQDISDTADLILQAADEGKNVTLGFVMQKDTSENAKNNVQYLINNSYNIENGDVVSPDVYSIYISIKADGVEIGRIPNLGAVLDNIDVPVPANTFDENSRDSKSGRLYMIGKSRYGYDHLDTGYLSGTVDGNVFHADVYSWSYTNYESFVFVGRSEVSVAPYSDCENDKDAAKSASRCATAYRSDPTMENLYVSGKVKQESKKIVEAYNAGKQITAHFVMEKINPTQQQINDILDNINQNDYAGFTPLEYYCVKQDIYADGQFLTTLSRGYNGQDYSINVSAISQLPQQDPRYNREFIFLGTYYVEDGNDSRWETSSERPWDVKGVEGTNVSGSFYCSDCSIYAFGYYNSGDYTASFGTLTYGDFNGGAILNGVEYKEPVSRSFNFLSDDEELSIKDFFGYSTASDPLRPYAKFIGWQTSYYDNSTNRLVMEDAASISKNSFKNNSTYIDVYPKFDETIPKNSGTYYIALDTFNERINLDELPTLNGKITWKEYQHYGYGFKTYLGLVSSSDFTEITIPEPYFENRQLVGWNCEFDKTSGTLKTHSSKITKADFSSGDAVNLKASYKYPADVENNPHYMAILNANGGLVDGKNIGYYRSSVSWSAQSYSLNLIVPERTGYKFLGWNTKQDGSGDMIDDVGVGSVTIFTQYHNPVYCDENNNVTLYAQWQYIGDTVLNNSTLSSTTVDLGESVTVNGAAIGGSGTYTYEYYYKLSSSNNWTKFGSTANNAVLTPSAAGKYDIRVYAKDSNGKAGVKNFSLTVTNLLKNNSTVSKTEFTIGEAITVTAAASGGTGPYTYEMYYKRSTVNNWTKFGSNGKGTFQPGSAGTFEIRIYVKDNAGTTAVKNFTLTGTAQTPLTNNTTLNKTSVNVGETAVVTGAASGGLGTYTYEFYYKLGSESSWTKFGTKDSAELQPKTAGQYDIRVYVKDRSGKKQVKNLTLTAVIPALANNTTVSKTNFTVGETITVTGAASGGSGTYTYEFYYKRSTVSTWTKFGSNGKGTFKPGSAGTFTIRTYAKDSRGASSMKEFTLTATAPAPAALTNNTTVSKTDFKVGEAITVTGAASGGSGTYTYEFYYKRSTVSTWTKFGSNGKGTFQPGSAGTFTIRTYAKDSKGASSMKEFTLTATEPLTNKTTVTKTDFKVGETITVTGAASGGSGTYTYEFYYKRDTASSWTKFDKNGTGTFKPGSAGTFTIKTYVKDSNGSTSVKSFTLKAT